jgi:hypothetical protein
VNTEGVYSKNQFEESIFKSEESKIRYKVSSTDFDEIVRKFETDESNNPILEIKKHQVIE